MSVVLVRKHLDKSNFFSASFMVIVTSTIILWPVALLLTNLRIVNIEGILFFAFAGIISEGIHLIIYFKGVETIGVSLNASIYASFPIFSTVLAVLFLSEIIAPANWFGTICIVAGVIFIERNLNKSIIGFKRIPKKGLIFPLLAAFTLGLSMILRKYGLTIYQEPALSAAIGFSGALIFYIIMMFLSTNRRNNFSFGKDFRLFWKAGAFMATGVGLVSFALNSENLSIVAPLSQLEPLFILFFTYIILKEIESISTKLVLSTVLIVIGAIFVSIK